MMTTGLQYAIVAGILLGVGLTVLVWRVMPGRTDLGDAVRRLSPGRAVGPELPDDVLLTPADLKERLGAWGHRRVPARWWGQIPEQDLAILQIPVSTFMGRKIYSALVGLFLPAILALVALACGVQAPPAVPAVVGLGLAALLFQSVNAEVKAKAAEARDTFSRAVAAYCDLVALERLNDAGTRQAMERAAAVADGWAFRRIAEELARCRFSGVPPWEALENLARELGVADLPELSEVLRLSSAEGASIYDSLRAKAAGMRAGIVTAEKAAANERSERLVLFLIVLGLVFLFIIGTPPVLGLLYQH